MRKLQVTPSQASYGVDLGNELLTAALAGGPSRTRRDFIGAVAQVSVGWNLPPTGFDYLQAFYRTATKNGAEPFLLDMVLDHAYLEEYTVKFVAGSYQIVGVQGLQTSVQAQLEVRPKPVDVDADLAILDAYEIYGDEVGNVFAALERLVNVTAPSLFPE